MGDEFIPDSDFEPDQEPDMGPAAQPAQQPSPASSPEFVPDNQFKADESDAQASPDFVPENQFVPDEEKFGSTGQQVAAGLEGIAQGVAGPLATGAERLAGVPAEDIAGRAAANPWIHGTAEAAGLVGGAFIPGLGEYSIGAKAAQVGKVATEATQLGKYGSAALNMAIQGGIIQGSDEISKAMLGQGDPETPVASALSHVGAAALFGGLTGPAFAASGNALQKMVASKVGQAATQALEDFGNEFHLRENNPDLVQSATNELGNYYNSTQDAVDSVWGDANLKGQAIAQTVPAMNDNISAQNEKISDMLQAKVKNMMQDTESYPPRLIKKFEYEANQWMQAATDPKATSADVFEATQALKQRLQAYSKFDRQVGPLSPEKDFIDVAKEVSSNLRQNLEDTSVWGKAGQLQKDTNSAFSKFLPAKTDFEKSFMTKVEGDLTPDPGKISTYLNQAQGAKGAIKQTKLQNFIDSADKFRSQVDTLHQSLGLDSPVQPTSLNVVNRSFKPPSPGQKLAGYFHDSASGGITHTIARAAVAGGAGFMMGGEQGAALAEILAPVLEPAVKSMGKKTLGVVIPAALKAMATENQRAMWPVVDYAASASQGAQKINDAMEGLFRAGGSQAFAHEASDKDREKIKNYVEKGELNKEIQSQLQKSQPVKPQGFAHGGYVEPLPPEDTSPTKPLLQGTTAISKSYPEQSTLLMAAKGRVNDYLNSLRPSGNTPKLAFDNEPSSDNSEKKYNIAVDIAAQPLSILNQVKQGTLHPETLGHFKSMYPEIHSHLSKKMTEKITEAQLKGEKPPYKVRQAMSLFLGSPLDSSMTPQAIQSAQSVYMKPQPQPQGGGKTKKGTSKLGEMSKQYQTNTQAAEARQKGG